MQTNEKFKKGVLLLTLIFPVLIPFCWILEKESGESFLSIRLKLVFGPAEIDKSRVTRLSSIRHVELI